MFSTESFVDACRAALDAEDQVEAVREAVLAALSEGRVAIDAVLGTKFKRDADTLYSSPDLTVQRILWPPGFAGRAHEHRMWAVVGVYGGEERNRLFERSANGLEESGGCALAEGEVLVLDEGAIHAVENPRRDWTAGLHVYGGDIVGAPRNTWGPDSREVPVTEDRAAARPCIRRCTTWPPSRQRDWTTKAASKRRTHYGPRAIVRGDTSHRSKPGK